jgi:hypothetical protein
MFFKAHSEGKIGYKRLTNADLGLGNQTSNQTHIGLFGDILTFLPDRDYEDSSMFIYNDKCMQLDFSFDRIETPNGGYRSPKIRKGGQATISVVSFIRDIAKKAEPGINWYLVWFGLESGMVVFYLFNDKMPDFETISTSVNLNGERVKGRVESSESRFKALIEFLESIVNKNSNSLIQELEIASQTGKSHKFRPFDIAKANELFKKTGMLGEALVAEYLDMMKHNGNIIDFIWENKSMESGLPYDFIIQDKGHNEIFIDVKSTSFNFDQPMVFSSQEMEFVSKIPNYNIYRVYDINEEKKHLRICENSKLFLHDINSLILDFRGLISLHNVELQSAKLAIPSINPRLIFRPEITF